MPTPHNTPTPFRDRSTRKEFYVSRPGQMLPEWGKTFVKASPFDGDYAIVKNRADWASSSTKVVYSALINRDGEYIIAPERRMRSIVKLEVAGETYYLCTRAVKYGNGWRYPYTLVTIDGVEILTDVYSVGTIGRRGGKEPAFITVNENYKTRIHDKDLNLLYTVHKGHRIEVADDNWSIQWDSAKNGHVLYDTEKAVLPVAEGYTITDDVLVLHYKDKHLYNGQPNVSVRLTLNLEILEVSRLTMATDSVDSGGIAFVYKEETVETPSDDDYAFISETMNSTIGYWIVVDSYLNPISSAAHLRLPAPPTKLSNGCLVYKVPGGFKAVSRNFTEVDQVFQEILVLDNHIIINTKNKPDYGIYNAITGAKIYTQYQPTSAKQETNTVATGRVFGQKVYKFYKFDSSTEEFTVSAS